jgi:hypothetical protein
VLNNETFTKSRAFTKRLDDHETRLWRHNHCECSRGLSSWSVGVHGSSVDNEHHADESKRVKRACMLADVAILYLNGPKGLP